MPLNFLELYKKERILRNVKGISAFFMIILFFFTQSSFAEFPFVSAPTILSPVEGQVYRENPWIEGLMKNETSVQVYVNDQYIGDATLRKDTSGTGSFAFFPDLYLEPGHHIVYTIAQDEIDGRFSETSLPISFVMDIDAPTLFLPLVNETTTEQRPYIIGVAKNYSHIEIYVNNVLDGIIHVGSHPTQAVGFAYLPKKELEQGKHEVYAKLVSTQKDVLSNVVEHIVGSSVAAPTILGQVVNASTTWQQPYVTGVAKNDSTIQVYVDNRLDGEFLVRNHESGTASFAYLVSKPLMDGVHMIRMRATDGQGNVSGFTKEFALHVHAPISVMPHEPSMPDGKGVYDQDRDRDVTDSDNNAKDINDENGNEEDDKNGEEPIIIGDAESTTRDNSLIILIILTIIVLIFLAWFIWTNREFFTRKSESENEEKKTDSDQEQPPSLF